jgi:ion channel POLLUX/CASTOR
MGNVTFRERFRYWFDNTMAKGPIAMMAWLFLISLVIIVIIAFLVSISGVSAVPVGDDKRDAYSFGELVWMGLMRTLDSGTMGGDTGIWAFRAAMLAVTLAGIFVVSSLIGIISSGLETKMDELRKGRSKVLEQDHTLILGWSDQVFAIISELVIANDNRKNPVIVVLADHDKVEMEDEIRARVPKLGRTRVVCRSGSPIDLSDLEVVSPQTSRSIIVLSPEGDDPDSNVIKTVLALTNNPKRRASNDSRGAYHIVAVIQNPSNLEAAHLVGRDEAHFVLGEDLISRITAQTCRQSGLSVVYTELLDFDGDEIYFQAEPSLTGKTYGQALSVFEDSSLMGLYKNGTEVLINPASDTKIESGDQLICISRDDDTIKPSKTTPSIDLSVIVARTEKFATASEKTLILGWNPQGVTIINELEQYVAPGSSVVIVANDESILETLKRECAGVTKQNLEFRLGDTTDRRTLESLDATNVDHVIVLAYREHLEVQQADAKTLITLLHLREIAEKAGKDMSIVSEMLDNRNRELAEVTKADDYIVSDKLISLMLSQISENKHLADVFRYLFSSDGSEIYLRPASGYVKTGADMNFYTVLEAARLRNETAIGYRIESQAHDADKAYGVRVNPKKSDMIRFSSDDKIIVLAEE